MDDRFPKTSEERPRLDQRVSIGSLMESFPFAVAILDEDLHYVQVNQRMAQTNGVPVVEHAGRYLRDVVPQVADLVEPCLRRVLQTGESVLGAEVRAAHISEPLRERVWQINCCPISLDAPSRPGIIATVQDVSERLKAERALRESESRRVEAERLAATARVAAAVAHELNNPLAGIGNCFALVKKAVPAGHRYQEYVELVDREIARMAGIVRRMYELHQPPAEALQVVLVEQAIREIVLLMEPNCRKHGSRVEMVATPRGLAVRLAVDSFRQILCNLLKNAIEASPPGEIVTIRTTLVGETLQCEVIDRGPGISTSIAPRVFEPFFTTKSGKGLGLGLSICRELAKSLNGSISFESVPGQDTVFRLILPLTPLECTS